jgi:hypothetical protein
VQSAPLRAPVLHVVARVNAYQEAELSFVEFPSFIHVGDREPRGHLVVAQAHRSLLLLGVLTNSRRMSISTNALLRIGEFSRGRPLCGAANRDNQDR